MKPLLLSYGGGHANIMVALARELDRRAVPYDLLGLTAAYGVFERAGLRPMDICALVDREADLPYLEAVGPFLPDIQHPDISAAQTRAYFGLGFADLVRRIGQTSAEKAIAQHGRKAFEPTGVFARYFEQNEPSVVVTTTSPRYELAAVRAARQAGIPAIAVGDQFLVGQSDFITGGEYADHLILLSSQVEENLRASGLRQPQVHLFGNPAFDTLAPQSDDGNRAERLRQRLGLTDRKVLFWPLGGADRAGDGEPLLRTDEVIAMLEQILGGHDEWRYLLRPHPNWPVTQPDPPRGRFCPPDMSPEDCLIMSDLVVFESSTMGLQAILKGIPAICFRHADYNHFPRYGWTSVAEDSDELRRLIETESYAQPPLELSELVGTASARTIDLVEHLHSIRTTGDETLNEQGEHD